MNSQTKLFILTLIFISSTASSFAYVDNLKMHHVRFEDSNGKYVQPFEMSADKKAFLAFSLTQTLVYFEEDNKFMFDLVKAPSDRFEDFLNSYQVDLSRESNTYDFTNMKKNKGYESLKYIGMATNELKKHQDQIKHDMIHFLLKFVADVSIQVERTLNLFESKSSSNDDIMKALFELKYKILAMLSQTRNVPDVARDVPIQVKVELDDRFKYCYKTLESSIKNYTLDLDLNVSYYDKFQTVPLKFDVIRFIYESISTEYYPIQKPTTLALLETPGVIEDLHVASIVPICHEKDVSIEVHIDILVGSPNDAFVHIADESKNNASDLL